MRKKFTNTYLRLEIYYRGSSDSTASVVFLSETNNPSDGTHLGPTGADTSAMAAWTGSIAPSDWTGGCQSGVYWLQVSWYHADHDDNDEPDGDETSALKSASFACTGS